MWRLIRSFGFAFAGVGYALRTQVNLRIHVFAATCVVIAGFWLHVSTIEWAILTMTIMIVISTELFNTALEATLDRVSSERHALAKVAKDTAAGAVLVSAIGSVIIALLVFGPKLLALIGAR